MALRLRAVLGACLLAVACDRPPTEPTEITDQDMRTWFDEKGIQLPPERPEQTAKASDGERLLGDVTGNGTVTLWDLRVLWNYLISSDAPRWYDMDLLDIDRDGDADWGDLKLLGEHLSDPERGNLYGIGLPPERPFDIELVFVDGHGFSEAHQTLFEQAAAIWENLITADISDSNPAWGPLDTDDFEWWPGSQKEDWFGRLVTEAVDDVQVFVAAVELDGNTYGQGGSLWFRRASGLPLNGYVALSSRILVEENDEVVLGTMLHELGHVLGIGGDTWDDLLALPSRNHPGRDTHFQGTLARSAFLAAGGYYRRPGVPVHNEGFGRDGHWRASHVPGELMLPWISADAPLSAITVQALADLGYEVDPDRAEPYSITRAAKVVAAESRWRCGVGMEGSR